MLRWNERSIRPLPEDKRANNQRGTQTAEMYEKLLARQCPLVQGRVLVSIRRPGRCCARDMQQQYFPIPSKRDAAVLFPATPT
jgi:hypothetical protein